jgi:hypothetical protein
MLNATLVLIYEVTYLCRFEFTSRCVFITLIIVLSSNSEYRSRNLQIINSYMDLLLGNRHSTKKMMGHDLLYRAWTDRDLVYSVCIYTIYIMSTD